MDMVPDGRTMMGGLTLRGVARDIATDGAGSATIVDEARILAKLGEGRALKSIETEPGLDGLDELVGATVARGFRKQAATVLGDHVAGKTPLYLLIDDMPVASLISGYADMYVPKPPTEQQPTEQQPTERRMSPQSDICAGWASDGTMMTTIAREGQIPVPVGPVAPVIERVGDDDSWHAMESLPPGSMRRRRLLDLTQGPNLEIRAMFRDTYVDSSGTETVLHEYSYRGDVDPTTMTVVSSLARPRVLPWLECPSAAASADRLVGHRIGLIRDLVRTEFHGTSTCTHLNDLLRAIDDVAPLARILGHSA